MTKIKDDKVRVVVFCGGRGSANLIVALQKHPQISLTLLVNAYDDGASTGRMREFIPGMLGPSDIRKNISRLIASSNWILSELLEVRFPQNFSQLCALEEIERMRSWKLPTYPAITDLYKSLKWTELVRIKEYFSAFLSYAQAKTLDYGDCSLGNLLFAGCYLLNGRDFNRAMADFLHFCSLPSDQVLNITRGENCVLVGLKKDGQLLLNEAQIVGPGSSNIQEIFLLPAYLEAPFVGQLEKLRQEEKIRYLRSLEMAPLINPQAEEKILQADIIIYGPGTQYSSLLPSYLTQGLAAAIVSNINGEKIFVGNILQDLDIQNVNANALVEKLLFYLGRKGQSALDHQRIVNHFFFQQEKDGELTRSYVHFDQKNFSFPLEKVKLLDWESKDGKHSGGLVLDEILGLIQERYSQKIKNFHHTVSIIVPGLNEEKSVTQVLHRLSLLNFLHLGLEKEIIFVDGGSTDSTFTLAQNVSGVRAFKLPAGSGRGQALLYGLQRGRGNIIVFFPSDNEYNAEDIYRVIAPIINDEAKVVLGNRSIKCLDLGQRIRAIYGANKLSYLVSKYGGMCLSIVTLLLFNRYLSDTLTTLKAFRRDVVKKMFFTCRGVDFDLELIAKLCIKGEYIHEVPVDYWPRSKSEGKKISFMDGIRSLFVLLRIRMSTPRKDRPQLSQQENHLAGPAVHRQEGA